MMTVTRPRKVEEWEAKVKQLKMEHEIGFDDHIKVALLTSMMPTDFQDYVFQ